MTRNTKIIIALIVVAIVLGVGAAMRRSGTTQSGSSSLSPSDFDVSQPSSENTALDDTPKL